MVLYKPMGFYFHPIDIAVAGRHGEVVAVESKCHFRFLFLNFF